MGNWESRMTEVKKEDIIDELILLEESNCDYITKSGDIYKYSFDNNLYYKRKVCVNNNNGYVYVAIRCKDGVNRNRRVHILLAKTFLDNPNNYKIVGHKNNIKNDNRLSNLYWTTNQENTQKAFDDKLNKPKMGAENKSSFPIAVIENNQIIAVYGSIRECARYIENLSVSYLAKIISRNGNYKPRNKKYIYIKITLDDYLNTEDKFKNIYLTEVLIKKQQILFTAEDIETGLSSKHDNQKKFAKMHKLSQAMVSHAILNNEVYGGFKFELIKRLNYSESSAYDNLVKTMNGVTIQNINTNEVRSYNTVAELKKELGIKGHDIKQYVVRDNILMSDWKVISI